MLLLQRCGRKSQFAFSICCWLNSAGPRLGLSARGDVPVAPNYRRTPREKGDSVGFGGPVAQREGS